MVEKKEKKQEQKKKKEDGFRAHLSRPSPSFADPLSRLLQSFPVRSIPKEISRPLTPICWIHA